MKNVDLEALNLKKFKSAKAYVDKKTYHFEKAVKPEIVSFDQVFDKLDLKDGMTVSFHHHLRNGDYVLNMVMEKLHQRGLKNLKLAASSIFACHAPLVEMIDDGTVTDIETSYMSGPVAQAVSRGKLKNPAYITTHGGRPRSIYEGDLKIDVAFVASPSVDKDGAMDGSVGKSACGSLGYAVADAMCAKKVVAITDNLIDKCENPDIKPGFADYIVEIDQIGDPSGIVSGTTQVTKDPLGLKIARLTARLIDELGLIKDGFSMQTGAGGISLAVANEVKDLMEAKDVKGSFGSGGITGFFVEMLEKGLFESLEDVQCFDLEAIKSSKRNKNHHKISGSKYANPNDDCVAEKLDCVILGASEIDKDFNINVTTGSDGIILGGSGGHADTATGAKLTIITTKLFNARVSAVVDKVRTITTPGEVVDALVTEYGIAINPARTDLLEALKDTKLELKTIDELYDIATSLTGYPKKREKSDEIVGFSVFRDGTILDTISKVE
ncbi:citrate lyase subunit alpha [uncultured Anaerococcus sp.]|uniref:citrate lyase subunit alpha n=1 Tax=uncultured Anaerococcus sp. TaxID=293428 RepID=UPI0028898FB5|nr:citrate lyase subunit alpha [uncultured Anaerococcus sp.]